VERRGGDEGSHYVSTRRLFKSNCEDHPRSEAVPEQLQLDGETPFEAWTLSKYPLS